MLQLHRPASKGPGDYGASVSDRTHFAYAVISGAHYYVTSQSEVRTLEAPCGNGEAHQDCDVDPPVIISLNDLNKRFSRGTL